MDKRTNVSIKMLMAVVALMKSYLSKWTGKKPFENGVTRIETVLANINTEEQIEGLKSTGTTQGKLVKETLMRDSTLVIAGMGYDYADDNGLNDLMENIDINKSMLDRASDVEKVKICQTVNTEVGKVITAMVPDYVITPADLVSNQTLINNFNGDINKPDAVIDLGVTARINIKAEIKKGIHECKKLDKKMEYFKSSEPTFYSLYHLSRNIEQIGVRKKVIANVFGPVVDTETEAPVSGANVYILGTKVIVMTDAEGHFTLPVYHPVNDGLLIVEHPDYVKP